MRKTLLISLLLAGAVAHAASFDCAKAKTPQEKAICASPELSAADDQLAAAYRAALTAAPTELQTEVRDDQRLWLRWIVAGCKYSESVSSGELAECLLTYYRSRTKELEKMVLSKGDLAFVWRSVELGGANTDDGYLRASWPQSNARTADWRAWNKSISAAALQIASNGRVQQPSDWKEVWPGGTDIDVTVSIGQVGPDLITATVDSKWYGHGAAHPNHNFFQFNWMLKEQRALKPEDVFRAGSGWDEAMLEETEKSLGEGFVKESDPDNAGIWPKDLSQKLLGIVENPRKWQIDVSGITISFEPYEVACYACTPPPITIPWSDLQPYLQSGFVRPK